MHLRRLDQHANGGARRQLHFGGGLRREQRLERKTTIQFHPQQRAVAFHGNNGGGKAVAGAGLGQGVGHQHHIVRAYKFPDFKSALAFVNRVGEVAEAQGHHPDILLGWGKVEITTWTHAVDGLTESDFILAAKIDLLAEDAVRP